MIEFDPDVYTITIRKEDVDGETYYVGRVAEFMNVTAYENTHDAALEVIRSALVAIAARSKETGRTLPAPMSDASSEPSGRMTLRMPRSLHAKLNAQVQIDDMSANQLVNLALAEYLTGASIVKMASTKIANVIDENMTNLRNLHGTINSTLLSSSTRSFQQENTYSDHFCWSATETTYAVPSVRKGMQ